jgi:hypothetical protein
MGAVPLDQYPSDRILDQLRRNRVSEFDEIEGHDPAAEEAVTGPPPPLPVEVPEKPAPKDDKPAEKPTSSGKKDDSK